MARCIEVYVAFRSASYFDNKLRLVHESFCALESDVLAVPCYSNILSGKLKQEYVFILISLGNLVAFANVVHMAGSKLTWALRPYSCYEAGYCKLMPSYEFKNYKSKF